MSSIGWTHHRQSRYAARLHDVRFRQLETGLPAQFQTPDEIKKQRKIHDKLIEKGLQLIADSFLDQVGKRCEAAGVALTRQLLEGINYEEIVSEVNRGAGRLPGLIGFDPNRAATYDGGATVRSDVQVGENGRLIAEDETSARSSGRRDALRPAPAVRTASVASRFRQLGGVSRILRKSKGLLIVATTAPSRKAVSQCVDGSSTLQGERVRSAGAGLRGILYVCSAFDVEYHHVVFNNIKDVLSAQASKVFKFEEQEELHNNIIDKGLLKLCQANLKRAEVMAQEFADVPIKTQILVGKPFQVVMQWAEEIKPSLLVLSRHGAHRIENTQLGSQAENLVRLAPCNTLLIGTVGIRPEDIPWIEEDGQAACRGRPTPKCGSSGSRLSRRGSRGAPSRSTCSSRRPARRPSLRISGSTRRSGSCCLLTCSSSWGSARRRRSRWRRSRRPNSSRARRCRATTPTLWLPRRRSRCAVP